VLARPGALLIMSYQPINPGLGQGVMKYWKTNCTITDVLSQYSSTPVLHYSGRHADIRTITR